MAKKFGGQFSPNGNAQSPITEAPVDQRRVDAAGGRANVLFIPGILLAFFSLNEGPVLLVVGLVATGILTLAAWLLREGLRAEAAYNERKVARKPAFPRKMAATLLTGTGVALAAYTGDSGYVGSSLYGVAAAALHVAAFGIDPLSDKRMEGVDTFQQNRVAKVVEEAEDHLDVMRGQIETLRDRALTDRVNGFIHAANKMIRTVEEDPRDLSGVRKFLGVYLMGAKDATVKFVDLYKRNKDLDARADYEALLTDLEQNFAARTEKMLLEDRSDMDIEIKVLRDRLKREGVSPK